jgi:hypothetical protein
LEKVLLQQISGLEKEGKGRIQQGSIQTKKFGFKSKVKKII